MSENDDDFNRVKKVNCQACGKFLGYLGMKVVAICDTEECKDKLLRFVELRLSQPK